MNIDLLLTRHGESGLLCDSPLGVTLAGVIFDAQTHALTLEFGEAGDAVHMNIPVEEGHRDMLLFSPHMQVGMLHNGLIAHGLQVPLLYLNDPYGSNFGDVSPMGRPSRSMIRFEQFMKRCITGQPVHRENLSDENSAGCVLRGMNPQALEFVPQLVRARLLEAGHTAIAKHLSAPQAQPMPGLGTGGTQYRSSSVRQNPLKDEESE